MALAIDAAARRSERIRIRRNQRARHPGGSPGATSESGSCLRIVSAATLGSHSGSASVTRRCLPGAPPLHFERSSRYMFNRRSTPDPSCFPARHQRNVPCGTCGKARNVAEQAAFDPAEQNKRRTVFVFSGQGSHWPSMGRDLYAHYPVFRTALDECDSLFRARAGWSVIEETNAPDASSRLNDTRITQPAIFSIQIALTALWSSWGITPDVVVGHSLGEAAAAHTAGVLFSKRQPTLCITAAG